MELKEMIVTDEKGSSGDEIKGTIRLKDRSTDPFTFYALENPTTGSTAIPHEIQIVMPLGGNDSGFFRQPRVGEKVLIAKGDSTFYLMGYIPRTQKCFSTFCDGQGADEKHLNDYKAQVIRYKHNGENFTDHDCSEIGFYSRENEITLKGTDDEKGKFFMDDISIKSTGAIRNNASESYSVLADALKFKVGGKDNKNAGIEISPDGKITINAASSIKLKVGKTSLSISDSGFSVSSKMVDTPIENTYDASLSLKAMSGFSARGMKCSMTGIKGASVNDSMGGKLSVGNGMGNIVGRELELKTYDQTEYAWLSVSNTLDFVFNTLAMSEGMDYLRRNPDKRWGETAGFVRNVLKATFDIGKEIYDLYSDFQETKEKLEKAKEMERKEELEKLAAQGKPAP